MNNENKIQEIYQKRIEEAAKKTACPQCVFNDGGTCNNDDDCKLLDDFVGLMTFALQNQWISVEEALPPCPDDDAISEVSISVIVRTSEGLIRYAYYHHYLQQWFSVETSTRLAEVTHWMFVPEEGGEE